MSASAPLTSPSTQGVPLSGNNPHATAASWARRLAPHRRPDLLTSLWQVVNSLVPFVALWILMLESLAWPYWTTLLIAVVAAGLQVRLFIIMHDCGHGSFLASRSVGDVLGSVLGVLTLTPYHYWKREHAIHHATSGLLDRRGHGDIDMLTVEEYRALRGPGKLLYRLYRHPFLLFVLGPAVYFVVNHRLPLRALPETRAGWWSLVGTNVAIAAIVAALIAAVGLKRFLLVQVPITVIASSAGVWLFYVQHQFEGTYWRRKGDWSYGEAALRGSSWYDLGRVLQWFTGNIGLHHIHHLNSGIPNYRLQRCLEEHAELRDVTRLTLLGSFKCAKLALWDETKQALVGFSALRKAPRPSEAAGA